MLKTGNLMLLFFFIINFNIFAGEGGNLQCGKCGYKSGSLFFGSGQSREAYITLFCSACKEFYNLKITDHLGNAVMPDPFLYILYLYGINKKISFYQCPKCSKPAEQISESVIMQAQKKSNYLICPKCRKESLYLEMNLHWD